MRSMLVEVLLVRILFVDGARPLHEVIFLGIPISRKWFATAGLLVAKPASLTPIIAPPLGPLSLGSLEMAHIPPVPHPPLLKASLKDLAIACETTEGTVVAGATVVLVEVRTGMSVGKVVEVATGFAIVVGATIGSVVAIAIVVAAAVGSVVAFAIVVGTLGMGGSVDAPGTVLEPAPGTVLEPAPGTVLEPAPGTDVVSKRPFRLREEESDDPPQAERAMSAIESREARSFIKVQTLKRKWTKCTEVQIGCQVCLTDQIPQAV